MFFGCIQRNMCYGFYAKTHVQYCLEFRPYSPHRVYRKIIFSSILCIVWSQNGNYLCI